MKTVFLILVLAYTLYAGTNFSLKINNLNETKINDKGVVYKITAKTRDISGKKLNQISLFLNKEKFVEDNSFYTNGTFEIKGLKLTFKKAYFYQGDFIMKEIDGSFGKTYLTGQKAVFKHDSIDFFKTYIKTSKKTIRKLKYSVSLNQ